MDILVADLGADAKEIGLTKESIQAAVESRLRAARLYNSKKIQYLYVSVSVDGPVHIIVFEYNKNVLDNLSQESFPAATWQAATAGEHGHTPAVILSIISRHMDQFLVEYLRVNEKACAKR